MRKNAPTGVCKSASILRTTARRYRSAMGNPERAEEYPRRLHEMATHHEARKYIAVAHKLLAEVAAARGDLAEGEKQLTAALDKCVNIPCPLSPGKLCGPRSLALASRRCCIRARGLCSDRCYCSYDRR